MSSNIFFTSDSHFGHANIIKYAKRSHRDVHDMHEDMITKWNSLVKRGDIVYHLGDFVMGKKELFDYVMNRLNGTIRLIRGNHDKIIKGDLIKRFDWVKDYYETDYSGTKIVMCHYAFRVWNKSHHGSWNLHGHSHGSLQDLNIKQLDVGVDTNNMYPYSIEEIEKEMNKRGFDAPDNHGKRRK